MTIYLKIILKLKVWLYIYNQTSFYLDDSATHAWDKCSKMKPNGTCQDEFTIFARILT